MTGNTIPISHAHDTVIPLPTDGTARVELTFIARRIEHTIRFGQPVSEQPLDRQRRLVFFAPNMVFALARWAATDLGTVISRIDIVRAVGSGEPYQTLPFVRPGGEILLKIEGFPNVAKVLAHIDAIEAGGIDPAEVSPDHWRHVANRMIAGHQPRAYDRAQHAAFLLRRRIAP